MRKLSPERKLRWLSYYMDEFIRIWPNKVKPFDSWVDSKIDKKIAKGKHEKLEHERRICRYCRREFDETYINKTKDHIVPVSRGGLDKKENRVPCCEECNVWKADKLLDDWHEEIKVLVKKGKPRKGYELSRMGLMMGNIRHLINYVKSNSSKVSMYRR